MINVTTLNFDFVVVGGGLTGLCAAISAARGGAKTALIHDRPVLGGNASSEIRMHICGANSNMKKPELIRRGRVVEKSDIKDNFQRLVKLNFNSVICDTVKLTFTKTWGDLCVKVFEIRVY